MDAAEPRNAAAAGAHGLLGLEGINPLELLARGRAEVETNSWPDPGKTTASVLLAQRLGIRRISVGDLHRSLAAEHARVPETYAPEPLCFIDPGASDSPRSRPRSPFSIG